MGGAPFGAVIVVYAATQHCTCNCASGVAAAHAWRAGAVIGWAPGQGPHTHALEHGVWFVLRAWCQSERGLQKQDSIWLLCAGQMLHEAFVL